MVLEEVSALSAETEVEEMAALLTVLRTVVIGVLEDFTGIGAEESVALMVRPLLAVVMKRGALP